MSTAYNSLIIQRKSFAKIKNDMPLPNLIEVQSRSFNDLVQLDCLPEERRDIGLERVFKNIFPVNYSNIMSLEYIGYELGIWQCSCGKLTGIQQRYSWECLECNAVGTGRLNDKRSCPSCKKDSADYLKCESCLTRVKIKPALTVEECRSSSQTFSLPLRVKVQLICWDNPSKDTQIIRDVKEQDIFFLDLPIMEDIYEENNIYYVGSTGRFIINGVERVVVSQIHRAPGVVF